MSASHLMVETIWKEIESTATRILDQRDIKRVVGESQRKEEYACFPENFCACYSFFYDIVNRGEQLCLQVFTLTRQILQFDQLVILL
ncbi:hypothetical protein UlMin_033805 [Ulmus minor]